MKCPYSVCVVSHDKGRDGYHYISFLDENNEVVEETKLCTTKLDCRDEYEAVAVCDSHSAIAGEAGWQLFGNDDVDRELFLGGYLLLMDAFSDYDWIPLVEEYPELLREIAEAVIRNELKMDCSKIKEGEWTVDNNIYLVYYGVPYGTEEEKELSLADRTTKEDFVISSSETDNFLMPLFQKAGFGVFHCLSPICGDEEDYIALYTSLALFEEGARDELAAMELDPDVDEEESISDEEAMEFLNRHDDEEGTHQ